MPFKSMLIGKVVLGLGSKVVKTLCEDLYGTNRHVYFHNYFSSVDLLQTFSRSATEWTV